MGDGVDPKTTRPLSRMAHAQAKEDRRMPTKPRPTLDEARTLSDAELSALVAEKVMGWRKVGALDETERTYFETTWDARCVGGSEKAPRRIDCRRFRPASRLEDAWEVLMKMDRAFAVSSPWHNDWFRCELGDRSGITTSMQAETAPRAICLAALLAVGAVDG